MKNSDFVKVYHKVLFSFCKDVLLKAGVAKDIAEIVSDSLVTAELIGFQSHGVVRLPHYLKRIKIGSIKAKPNIRVIKKKGNTALVNGDDGLGHAVGVFAMREAIKLAKNGVGFVGVQRSSHFGIASYIGMIAAKKDMIGVVLSHTDASVIPFGGKRPAIGTNPLSVVVPTDREFPIILDMATSAASLGKIIVARKKGENIPSDWGVDEDGVPTTDPNKVKYLLPMAGAKGYALSFVIDILCGPLTGSPFGVRLPLMYGDYDKPRQLGHFIGVINIKNFIPIKEFKRNVGIMIDDIHDIPPAKGFDRVMVPGEKEYLTKLKYEKEGIPLPMETVKELREIAKEYKIKVGI